MTNKLMKFEHSDSWIFLCIPRQEPGINREEILAAADHINHAVPTNEELEGALKRGIETGLIASKKEKYFYTEKYRNLIKKIFSSRKDIFKVWDELEQFLTTL